MADETKKTTATTNDEAPALKKRVSDLERTNKQLERTNRQLETTSAELTARLEEAVTLRKDVVADLHRQLDEALKASVVEDRTVVLGGKTYTVVGDTYTVKSLVEAFQKRYVEEDRVVVLIDAHHGLK